MEKKHIDKYIFFICLAFSLALFVGGFFCPPMGVIDGSVLKADGSVELVKEVTNL